jgi:hypothetical protein
LFLLRIVLLRFVVDSERRHIIDVAVAPSRLIDLRLDSFFSHHDLFLLSSHQRSDRHLRKPLTQSTRNFNFLV